MAPPDPDLHAAARSGDLQALQAGIAKGVDLNARDKLSRTPLMMAAWAGQTEFVRLLLAHGCNTGAGASDDMNALHFAAQKGQLEAARLLLTHAKLSPNGRTRKGITALHIAAQQGHVELVKLLLHRKGNPAATNNKGQTPADVAKTDEIKQLLESAAEAAKAALPAKRQAQGGEDGGDGDGDGAEEGGGQSAFRRRQQQRPSNKRAAPGGEDGSTDAHTGKPTTLPAPEQEGPGEEADEQPQGFIGPELGPQQAAAKDWPGPEVKRPKYKQPVRSFGEDEE